MMCIGKNYQSLFDRLSGIPFVEHRQIDLLHRHFQHLFYIKYYLHVLQNKPFDYFENRRHPRFHAYAAGLSSSSI